MRTFEILIPVTLGIYILWPFFTGRKNPRLFTWLPVLAAALIGAHLLIEGYRWQMIPLYVLTGVILLTAIPKLFQPATGEFKRISWTGAGLAGTLILLAASIALPVLLPVPNVPTPSGPYSVGTQTFVLTDTPAANYIPVRMDRASSCSRFGIRQIPTPTHLMRPG